MRATCFKQRVHKRKSKAANAILTVMRLQPKPQAHTTNLNHWPQANLFWSCVCVSCPIAPHFALELILHIGPPTQISLPSNLLECAITVSQSHSNQPNQHLTPLYITVNWLYKRITTANVESCWWTRIILRTFNHTVTLSTKKKGLIKRWMHNSYLQQSEGKETNNTICTAYSSTLTTADILEFKP